MAKLISAPVSPRAWLRVTLPGLFLLAADTNATSLRKHSVRDSVVYSLKHRVGLTSRLHTYGYVVESLGASSSSVPQLVITVEIGREASGNHVRTNRPEWSWFTAE